MANVWADKQYYKLISRNRVPFVRYGGAGRGLISSKWCNRPWPVTLQYQFDPANGPSVPRNCKQTYSKGEKRPDRFVVTRTRYSNGLVNSRHPPPLLLFKQRVFVLCIPSTIHPYYPTFRETVRGKSLKSSISHPRHETCMLNYW